MVLKFHVLTSGSGGNAHLLQADGFGVLIDFGAGPRVLAQRLRACGAGWQHVHAAVLTHTHGDHWNALTLAELLKRQIPLYCHPDHTAALKKAGPFAEMFQTGLVRFYEARIPWALGPGLECRPFDVRHDSGRACGFRFEGPGGIFGKAWAVAHASDLGCWDADLVPHLADVDLLALEFNHDVALQRRSGRPYHLIRRVLGDHGHLSNEQAAALVAHTLERSEPGRLQHLVQLHLSQECNRPELAQAAVRGVLQRARTPARVHTACQAHAGPSLLLEPAPARRRPRRPARPPAPFTQPLLPGWE